MIDALEPNQVFVFGSNKAGLHYGGAAKQAYEQFGAVWAVGEGLTGQSYAFPTLDENFERRPLNQLKRSRVLLYEEASKHPELTFLLTKVGCGIAGYPEITMQKLFTNAPENIIKPSDW